MTVATNRRDALYLEETVATASPAKLLTMLYDRLARDLRAADEALQSGNRTGASASIRHAVEIITELLATLDGGSWSGAAPLARVYAWILSQLTRADVRGDTEALAHCRGLVEELRAAWREAATMDTTTARRESA